MARMCARKDASVDADDLFFQWAEQAAEKLGDLGDFDGKRPPRLKPALILLGLHGG